MTVPAVHLTTVRKRAENDGLDDDAARAPIAHPPFGIAQSVKFTLSNVGRMPKSRKPSNAAPDAPEAVPQETNDVVFNT
jgi:hypothetical protein